MAETVTVNLNLGSALKTSVRKAAKASGVSVNEFICNALESRVRRDGEYRHGEDFIPHVGKHFDGKRTGYEITEDGKYYPAPLWADLFAQLFAEKTAIITLTNSVVVSAQERLIAVEKAITKAKSDLIDDLGLDPSRPWVYHGGAENYLVEAAPEQDAKSNEE